MAEGLGGLLSLLKGKMTDDQGLFQGGHQGRMFGRARDAWDKNAARNMGDTGNLAGQVQPSSMGYNMPVKDTKPGKLFSPSTWGNQSDPGSQSGDAGYKQADSWMKNFNPQDKNDVLKIQKMFGLEEDGIFGPKTLSAVRQFQGNREGVSKDKFGFGNKMPTDEKQKKLVLEKIGGTAYANNQEGLIPDNLTGGKPTKEAILEAAYNLDRKVGGQNFADGNEGFIPDSWTGGEPTMSYIKRKLGFGGQSNAPAPQGKVLAPQHRPGFGTQNLNSLMNWNDDDSYADVS